MTTGDEKLCQLFLHNDAQRGHFSWPIELELDVWIYLAEHARL